MNYDLTRASLLRGVALVALLGLLGVAPGCSSAPPPQELTLKSSKGQTFTGQFSRAYMTHDSDGDTDLVLIDRAAEQALGHHPDSAPVRQVMHIRVLWNPKRDQKTDHNSASNATVHWYVMGNTPRLAADVLEYCGTAFVSVDDSGEGAELTIRNASVAPVACRGELQDPVGSSRFEGTIHAVENRQRVMDALSSVRTVVVACNALRAPVSSAKAESPSSSAR